MARWWGGWPLVGALIATIALSACSAAAPTSVAQPGAAHFVLGEDRQLQYVSAQLAALKVTLTRSSTGASSTHTYSGKSLVNGRLGFEADNLAPATYTARIDAYLDAAQTLKVGSTTSSAFTVKSGATTVVSLPPLALAATPVGKWTVGVTVTLPGGYSVKRIDWGLSPADGSTVATQSLSTTQTSVSRTWSNVPAYPTGRSTASVYVLVTRKNKPDRSATAIATLPITADTTLSSTITLKP